MISNRLSLIKRSLGKERKIYHYARHCENFFFSHYFLQFSQSPTNTTQDFVLPVDKEAPGSETANATSVQGTGDQNPLGPNIPLLRKLIQCLKAPRPRPCPAPPRPQQRLRPQL